MSLECQHLITSLLRNDPRDRPTIFSIKTHPWMHAVPTHPSVTTSLAYAEISRKCHELEQIVYPPPPQQQHQPQPKHNSSSNKHSLTSAYHHDPNRLTPQRTVLHPAPLPTKSPVHHVTNVDPINGFKHHTSALSSAPTSSPSLSHAAKTPQTPNHKRTWARDCQVDSLIDSFMKIRQEKERENSVNLSSTASKDDTKSEGSSAGGSPVPSSLHQNQSNTNSPGKFKLGPSTKSRSFNDFGVGAGDQTVGSTDTAGRERRHSLSEGQKTQDIINNNNNASNNNALKSLFEQMRTVAPLPASVFARYVRTSGN